MELRTAGRSAAGVVVVAGCAATLIVAGCTPSSGGDDATGDSSDNSAPAPPTVGLTPFTPIDTPPAVTGDGPITDSAVLAGRLLSIADLPPGYTGYDLPPPDPSAPGAAAEDRSSTDPAECAAVLAPIATQRPGVVSAASVSYGGPRFSSLDQDAASYDGPGASTAFGTVQDALTRCTRFSGTDADGVPVDYRVGASTLLDDAAPIGDASVAVRLAVTSDGVSLTTDAVVTMVGSTVSQLVATGVEPVDPDLIRTLARTAADRLR